MQPPFFACRLPGRRAASPFTPRSLATLPNRWRIRQTGVLGTECFPLRSLSTPAFLRFASTTWLPGGDKVLLAVANQVGSAHTL